MPANNKIKELAVACKGTPSRGGTKCWGNRLAGDAKLFVEEIRKMNDAGEELLWDKIVKTLQEKFGVDRQIASIRKHIFRKCKCE